MPPHRRRPRWILAPACGILIAATTAPAGAEPPARMVPSSHRDLRGVFHVHSRFSHDATGSLDTIVQSAARIGLDFVVITDHQSFGEDPPADVPAHHLVAFNGPRPGRYGSVQVLVGGEVSLHAGHLIVLDADLARVPVHVSANPQETIANVHRAGGLAIIAHPSAQRKPWRDWSVTQADGIEIYSVADDLLDEHKLALVWRMLWGARHFTRWAIDRPDDALARWDALTRQERVVGLAGCNVHGRFGIGPWRLDSYERLMRQVSTHVLATSADELAIYRGLREGHVYVALDQVAESRGFTFWADVPSRPVPLLMGDEHAWTPGTHLRVASPHVAVLHLYRDGVRIGEAEGREASWPAEQPGTYRVEAWLETHPWVFANPIYLRAATPP